MIRAKFTFLVVCWIIGLNLAAFRVEAQVSGVPSQLYVFGVNVKAETGTPKGRMFVDEALNRFTIEMLNSGGTASIDFRGTDGGAVGITGDLLVNESYMGKRGSFTATSTTGCDTAYEWDLNYEMIGNALVISSSDTVGCAQGGSDPTKLEFSGVPNDVMTQFVPSGPLSVKSTPFQCMENSVIGTCHFILAAVGNKFRIVRNNAGSTGGWDGTATKAIGTFTVIIGKQ